MTVCRKKPPARSCKAPSPAPLDPVVFTALRRDYHTRWGVALVAVDPEGRPVLGGRRGITEAQRECWRRLVWEAWRWGEPSLALAPDGTLACGVPLMRNQTLLGGLVTGGLSATACARGTADGAPNAAEDLLDPVITIEHQPTADKIRQARFVAQGIYDDRDWDFLRPALKSSLRTDLLPWPHSPDSWHFYRHSFAAWNLTGWEALQATALAGQTRFTVRRKQVVFEKDTRPRMAPKVDVFPR